MHVYLFHAPPTHNRRHGHDYIDIYKYINLFLPRILILLQYFSLIFNFFSILKIIFFFFQFFSISYWLFFFLWFIFLDLGYFILPSDTSIFRLWKFPSRNSIYLSIYLSIYQSIKIFAFHIYLSMSLILLSLATLRVLVLGLVSLLISMSIFVGYLMPKPSSLKNRTDII